MRRILFAVFGSLLAAGVFAQSAAQSPKGPADAQQAFDSPKMAADALLQACKENDSAALARMFGSVFRELTKDDDDAEERVRRRRFSEQAQQLLKLEEHEGDRVILVVGKELWPFPIPLVKGKSGWMFNTSEGVEELKARRIGQHELAALDVCREYVSAQREYASYDHDGDGVLEYAQRIRSSSGMHDGLFWPADEKAGEPLSPLGPFLAQAEIDSKDMEARSSFMGYSFKPLTRQGGDVPGGKYDYIINGNMIAGFALVAWPADYRRSGIMTFVVSHHGRIYQKDLGPQTREAASAMSEFNPDETWTAVTE